jgi:hypothetical protein
LQAWHIKFLLTSEITTPLAEDTQMRAPTLEEIKKLCEYPDRRIKAIVYTMISSGIRVGAWDYLIWGNIRPIQEDGKIVAARMVVYDGEDDSYISYITPSAYRELAEWVNYRKESGEVITDESWVIFFKIMFILVSRIDEIYQFSFILAQPYVKSWNLLTFIDTAYQHNCFSQ